MVDRTRKGVVDGGDDAGFPARPRRPCRRRIHSSVGLIGDSKPNSILRLRPIADAGSASASIDTNRRATELWQQVLEDMERAAVDRRTAHDLVAGLEQRQHRRRDRGHARTEQQRLLRAIERCQLLLRGYDRRVLIPRVEIAIQFAFGVLDDVGPDRRRTCGSLMASSRWWLGVDPLPA